MYEAFYGLKEKPFTILPDPGFLYLGQVHSMAYSMLEYGVVNRAAFTVITGEIGSGKTTLVRHLLNGLGRDARVGLISNTQRDFGELLQWVLLAFGLDFRAKTKIELYDTFTKFLIAEYGAGRRTLLIIDEAQNLDAGTLEELRMLSNINADKDQLLQMILVGQPGLRDQLHRPELVQFAQRISVDYHIKPLSLVEGIRYIHHRVRVAGREEPLFANPAAALIHRAARGLPRRINILADLALVYAFCEEAPRVDRTLVYNMVKELAANRSLQLSGVKVRDRSTEEAPAAPQAAEGDTAGREESGPPSGGGGVSPLHADSPRPAIARAK